MLARGPEILIEARAAARAVPAFTVNTLESIRAVGDAAEHAGLPVILQAGSGSCRETPRPMLATAALAAARAAAVPVGVHLDHSTDLAEIRDCLARGYTSVMVDGSHLPLDENVALTRTVVGEAHHAGAWVEAEIGALVGGEDASTGAKAVSLAEPDHARELVERTGVDALATAVGTVHGFTTEPLTIDLDRLCTIAEVTSIPQVLHGASGLADSQLRAAVDAGVAKVNISAELRRAFLAARGAALAQTSDDIRQLQRAAVTAMADVAGDRLTLLGRPAPDGYAGKELR
jgi:ketose-bisphosphate aldolase